MEFPHLETVIGLEPITFFVSGLQHPVPDNGLFPQNYVERVQSPEQHSHIIQEEQKVDSGTRKTQTQNHPPRNTPVGGISARDSKEKARLPDDIPQSYVEGFTLQVTKPWFLIISSGIQRLQIPLQPLNLHGQGSWNT